MRKGINFENCVFYLAVSFRPNRTTMNKKTPMHIAINVQPNVQWVSHLIIITALSFLSIYTRPVLHPLLILLVHFASLPSTSITTTHTPQRTTSPFPPLFHR